MMAERDHAHGELDLLRREVEILRGQREGLVPHRRPDFRPEHRLAILQLMRMRDWRVAVVARRFVLHPNTIRSWIKAVEGRGNDRLLTPAVVWNRVDDVVRWAVHEPRRLCPEPEFGTRTIARHLVRAGIAITEFGAPRFLITDHGSQFRRRFKAAMTKRGIRHVRGRVRAPFLNGKCERLFKTFRGWWRLVLSPITVSGIQTRLDCFRGWYDEYRPHSSIHGLTPAEAWNATALPEPIPIRARDQLEPQIDVRRRCCRGDPRLPIIDISVHLHHAA
jgi:transposase InsO family protein